MRRIVKPFNAAFTLIEVMIAVAFIGIAMLALLSLHHTDISSVIRGQQLTQASALAQALMAQAELERFPAVGTSQGNFAQMYPGQFQNFHWKRVVEASPVFPDIRRVQIKVLYGNGFVRGFTLTEFMHNPIPPTPAPNANPDPDQGN
jgi:type II secretion system protein I